MTIVLFARYQRRPQSTSRCGQAAIEREARPSSPRRVYGYDIVKQLRGIDALVIREGTVYPILSRLKRDGLVSTSLQESPEGPARKYYELTPRGKQVCVEMNAYWDVLKRGIDTLKKERGGARAGHG